MIEADGLDGLIGDLTKAPLLAGVRATKVVTDTSKAVRDTSRSLAPGTSSARHYPKSITYDVEVRADVITGEVGPDKALPQGALGNLFEYGSRNNPPMAHNGPALDRHAPQFVDDLAEAAVKSLW